MLWFGPGKFVYTYSNQSSKYTNGTFQLKSPNRPDELFYLSIIVERFTIYNLVVLYLCLLLLVKILIAHIKQTRIIYLSSILKKF